MKFIADLHIHSKYSIATAKNLDLENLYIAAQKKGITVVGTGDFTHPGWMAELKEKLIPAEPGLFRLKKEIESACDRQVSTACHQPVRFMLTAEISNIYKKDDKTRKNHNLVFAPDFTMAERFNTALDRIGNIKSDGRPILGLDARNLLELVLETSEKAMFIPAHIWTPWFSLLGSKSGFDSVEACFGDLAQYIFAVETGLSSDPAMNWRVSDLDRMTLVSNSDAHSPMKLGREANLFNTDLSYMAIRQALMTGDPELFKGTLEFFPEEGKYHLDGHKKCGVRFRPEQTIQNKGVCPVCKKPLTLGVLYRVEALADRETGERPPNAHPYRRLVALANILSQILDVGINSKKVRIAYQKTISALGDELSILLTHPIDMIEKKSTTPLLGEAIRRMRTGRVDVAGGYDGEYGTIRLFGEDEKSLLMGQRALFVVNRSVKTVKKARQPKRLTQKTGTAENALIPGATGKERAVNKVNIDLSPNPAQEKAVLHGDAPLIIAAGPGTGKTMTITRRMVHLITNRQVAPHHILALTFTHKAAEEMRIRLKRGLPLDTTLPTVGTFHAFCLELLRKQTPENPPSVIDDFDRDRLLADLVSLLKQEGHPISLKPETAGQLIMQAKQKIQTVAEIDTGRGDALDRQVGKVAALYQHALKALGVCDYEDLIFETVTQLEGGKTDERFEQPQYRHVFIDEYQDINEGQYRLIRALVPDGGAGLCVIGDPDQAIYGFRGSDVRFFRRFLNDFPLAESVDLNQNYRSTETILKASGQVIHQVIQSSDLGNFRPERHLFSGIKGLETIDTCEYPTERAEAAGVGRRIVEIIGGRGHHDLDLGRAAGESQGDEKALGDIAVLYRTGRQGEIMGDVFQKMGIPCQMVQRRRRHPDRAVRWLISILTVLEGKPLYSDFETIREGFPKPPSKKTIRVLKQWGLKNGFSLFEALGKARLTSIGNITRPQHLRLEEMTREIGTLRTELHHLTLAEKMTTLADRFGLYADNEKEPAGREIINEMIRKAGAYPRRTVDFLSSLALQTDTDTYVQNSQKVALMTMHAAKGLEFPVVFITGCEDGLIPFQPGSKRGSNPGFHQRASDADDIEEERRLFYVAMTRAQEALYLTWAKNRTIHGKRTERQASPFIGAIEASLLDRRRKVVKRKKAEYVQMSLFQ